MQCHAHAPIDTISIRILKFLFMFFFKPKLAEEHQHGLDLLDSGTGASTEKLEQEQAMRYNTVTQHKCPFKADDYNVITTTRKEELNLKRPKIIVFSSAARMTVGNHPMPTSVHKRSA